MEKAGLSPETNIVPQEHSNGRISTLSASTEMLAVAFWAYQHPPRDTFPTHQTLSCMPEMPHYHLAKK